MTRNQRRHQLSQARVRLNRMARHKPLPGATSYRSDIKVGGIVRYRSEDGAYHVRLIELGYKWARVQFFGPGVLHEDGTRSPRIKRVPVDDLELSLWNPNPNNEENTWKTN